MNNLVIKRSQLAEVQFTGTPSVNKNYAFTQIPNISRNNIIIYGFEVFSADQLAATPSGNTIVAAADIKNLVLTFVDDKNKERQYQVPAFTLVSSSNGGFVRMFKPFILNLTKSYAQLVAAGSVAEDQSLAVNIYYSIVGEN
jgi:hypothetical protein